MEIATFTIEHYFNNTNVTLYPTLISANGRHYLIDCGYEETFDVFVYELAKLGITIEDLYAVIISHDDIDHLGALHLFKNRNKNIKIICSNIEAPSVSGAISSERLVQAETSLPFIDEAYKAWAVDFRQQLKNIKRQAVDETFIDGEWIEEEMIAVHTPGHTKGHCSFYIPAAKTLIAADAVVVEDGVLNIANPMFTLDMNAAIKSVAKIKDLKPETLICYHGGIINEEVDEQLSALIAKYKNHIEQEQ